MPKELFPNLDDYFVNPRGVITTTSDQDLINYLEGHKFNVGLKVPGDDGILYYGDNLIGSRGNILAINGRAKSRKSVIASAIMSSAFCDGCLGFTTRFKKPPKVLHFDTEQGYSDWLEGCHRVLRDAGLVEAPAGYLAHHSRDCMPEMRLDLLRYALELYGPDVAVVDGVVDLVYDLNSQEEATTIGGELMALSVKYNCLIVVVIHLTKSNGYMTGALGTYLEKKCQTAIKCELLEDDLNVSMISCGYARRKPFAPFMIRHNEDDNSCTRLGDNEILAKSTPPTRASEEMRKRFLNQVFNLCGAHRNEGELRRIMRKAAGMIGLASDLLSKDATAWIKHWQQNQEIGPDPEGRIVRAERLVEIEKAAPRLDLNGPDYKRDQDLAPPDINPVDDLPF